MTLLLSLLLAAEAAGPQVTLPLEEYEKLRQLRERPSVTVVDLLRVEGSFGKRDLAVVLSGRASGTMPSAGVLSGDGFRLHSCDGDALVSRGEEGDFTVTPLAPRFRARCRIALDGSDRLEAQASRSVLEIEAAVADGELVSGESGDGGREFSVVRRIAGGKEDLPPSAAGRYRVTLLPDETRFLYRLEVRNPNRRHHRLEVELRESEHVESVDAPVAWDVEEGTYRFDLPPGESAIELKGRLSGAAFRPPLEAAIQYLLVESHPLIRPEVTTGAKRVGVSEVGLPSQYRGAQAFLLDGDAEVGWKAVRLEALKTAGFSVPWLRQILFLGADGNARGEAQVEIDNQGAPALALPTSGEPTFASVASEPAFLTRDAEGRLFLPLGQGSQSVLVQDVRPFKHSLGLAAASLELPRLGVPASRADVELRYPAEWIPLYEALSPASRWHLLRRDEIFALALLLVLAERLLALCGAAKRPRLLLAGALALAAAFSFEILAGGLAAAGGLWLLLGGATAFRRLKGAWRALGVIGAGAVGFLAAVLFLGVVVRERPTDQGRVDAISSNIAAEKALRFASPAAPAPEGPGVLGKEKEPPANAYQGLPAHVEIPSGARQSHFQREMLATDVPRRVHVLMASARLAAAFSLAAALLALGVGLALRRDLAQALRGYLARLRSPAQPAPAP